MKPVLTLFVIVLASSVVFARGDYRAFFVPPKPTRADVPVREENITDEEYQNAHCSVSVGSTIAVWVQCRDFRVTSQSRH